MAAHRRAAPDASVAEPLGWREPPGSARQRELDARAWRGAGSVEDRLRIARRRLYLTAATGAATASVLVASAFFPPFLVLLIPPAVMTVDLHRKLRALAAHGYGFWDVVSSGERPRPARSAHSPPAPPPPGVVPAARRHGSRPDETTTRDHRARWRSLPAEATRGRHGSALRAAIDDGAGILELVDRLAPGERALLPELTPTVDALVERCAALALTLDRIDVSVAPADLPALDDRIARIAGDPAATDGARRLALLEHQRDTIRELLARRDVLAGKLDSASLTLRSLRFDLLRLRSAGMHSALDAMTNATQQARALSRDIGALLEAGEEVKGLGAGG